MTDKNELLVNRLDAISVNLIAARASLIEGNFTYSGLKTLLGDLFEIDLLVEELLFGTKEYAKEKQSE